MCCRVEPRIFGEGNLLRPGLVPCQTGTDKQHTTTTPGPEPQQDGKPADLLFPETMHSFAGNRTKRQLAYLNWVPHKMEHKLFLLTPMDNVVRENKLHWSSIYFFSYSQRDLSVKQPLELILGLGISQALIGLGTWLPFQSDGSRVFNSLGLPWDFSMDSEAAHKRSAHPDLPLWLCPRPEEIR